MKRQGTNNHHFLKRIPADLRDRLIGMELMVPIGDESITVAIGPKTQSIRFSLRASESSEVKRRHASVSAHLEEVFENLRENKPKELNQQQCVALSGEIYRAWSKGPDGTNSMAMEYTEGEGWERVGITPDESQLYFKSGLDSITKLNNDFELDKAEKMLGPILDKLLQLKCISELNPDSRHLALREAVRALKDGMSAGHQKASGDFRIDPTAERFPEFIKEQSPSGTLMQLVDDWWAENKRDLSVSTYESYLRAFNQFHNYLGQKDIASITKSDVISFKDKRIADGIAPMTIKGADLAALNSVFGWAEDNDRIASNPAFGVKIKVRKKPQLRSSSFTKPEIQAILKHSLDFQPKKNWPSKRIAALRWVPWICAYTGARVGEIAQLRKQDIIQKEGYWIIQITPEAGRVKTHKLREVPIHEHLVSEEFLKFVKSAPDGHLFQWTGDGRGSWRTTKNRITDFIREVVTDKDVQPNHGWRNTFKTISREVNIQEHTTDAICGHMPRTVGEAYGEVNLATKANAMERFPRYKS